MPNEESRYNRTVIIHTFDRFGNAVRRPFMDILRRYGDTDRPSNIQYRLRDTDRWHTLAHRRFGRGMDYWAILDFSNILDPFEELVTGNVVTLPSQDVLQFDVKDFEADEEAEGPA